MIQAIFFDFNGVIIDDERIHLKAYREVLLSYDIPLTDENYFASLGMDDEAPGVRSPTRCCVKPSSANTNCTASSSPKISRCRRES
jgi:hypothetical protein